LKPKLNTAEKNSSSAAFPKSYRLTKTDEFSSVFSFRKAIRSTHFLLHYRLQKDGEQPGARLGLVIAKRLLKRSVDRNLLRRLVREKFRLIRCDLPSRDIIFRLANKPKLLDRQILGIEIQELLGKLKTPKR